jgi:hypothetical protein
MTFANIYLGLLATEPESELDAPTSDEPPDQDRRRLERVEPTKLDPSELNDSQLAPTSDEPRDQDRRRLERVEPT